MSESFTFDVAARGAVTALVYRAAEPRHVTLILAHGAGAPQTHPFMIDAATRLSKRGVDVVTFNFLYSEQRRKMPDRTDTLEACWRAAIGAVKGRGGLKTERLFIGGKSMGGRIASHVAAADEGLALAGLVFLGYPLHPPGKPKVRRDAHLAKVPFPMLFVQGSKDPMGDEREMRMLCAGLPRAELHVIQGGDHSLRVAPRGDGAVRGRALDAAADAVVAFLVR